MTKVIIVYVILWQRLKIYKISSYIFSQTIPYARTIKVKVAWGNPQKRKAVLSVGDQWAEKKFYLFQVCKYNLSSKITIRYRIYPRPGTEFIQGTSVAQRLSCCSTNRKIAGSIIAGVSEFFIDIKSFRSHYDPGVESASDRNEYQEYFVGVKVADA